ncbi:UDP-N-acetyl-D-glucosamine 6-dehydrogenase [Mesorhizobium prunaredense]|uniref:UDP-N-acetyl-D-glucosamine 6-dehydrogenase n=1 Tax=Mesorhizobium prunaredense TaxID=1631249 RepID=A0A1R3VE13_9HYPH|nr:nucleotide sugar dehydrogenase [Mesorhizobium prunaredense]SIT58127.1 UDP-N-acetyl-D-glucosamine 6-dehydrogenase [Mesorhizobium prunaredense]
MNINKTKQGVGIDVGEALRQKLLNKSATVGVIGLGYVGLPLAAASVRGGYLVLGFDVDPSKIATLNSGKSYIDAVSSVELAEHVRGKRMRATADFDELTSCDVIVICVPTPLSRYREPDLHYVEATSQAIAERLREGQLVVLESTTYPGTTDEVVKPILEATGLVSGSDFFIGFSPEREDPGSLRFSTTTIPKVVSGDGALAAEIVDTFYSAVVEKTVRVSSLKVAEATKITENVFRSVNIALVNELKIIYDAMGINVWEVIDAAATKPFGFMPFYPGPGLGGHCIPIDPFYLTWKSRGYGLNTKFIELAGEINSAMPSYVIARLELELDKRLGKSLSRSKLLLIGLAYKKNVSDIRESPSLEIMEALLKRGADVAYHDPHVAEIPPTREHASLVGMCSVDVDHAEAVDAVLIITDHDAIDFGRISQSAQLIIDTRNVMARKGFSGETVVRA